MKKSFLIIFISLIIVLGAATFFFYQQALSQQKEITAFKARESQRDNIWQTAKIKSEILISDHLEIYGEIWKEYTNHETKQHEWEIGINIDVLKLMDKFKK